MNRFGLIVNGKNYTVAAEPDMPLLWVLRDLLQLKGTKFGCGLGLCGACTIYLDGKSVRSCQTTISEATKGAITTIEGLHPRGDHPIQKKWRENNVAQCGYCQSGQIMCAAELLKTNPRPSNSQIDDHMSGNICRCGTYPRIKDAIKEVAGLKGDA